MYVGFNEFCDPCIVDAIGLAVEAGVTRVLVLTTMMTAGGDHSERDIPDAIDRAKVHYPDVEMVYAWPFMLPDVAKFLAVHTARFR